MHGVVAVVGDCDERMEKFSSSFDGNQLDVIWELMWLRTEVSFALSILSFKIVLPPGGEIYQTLWLPNQTLPVLQCNLLHSNKCVFDAIWLVDRQTLVKCANKHKVLAKYYSPPPKTDVHCGCIYRIHLQMMLSSNWFPTQWIILSSLINSTNVRACVSQKLSLKWFYRGWFGQIGCIRRNRSPSIFNSNEIKASTRKNRIK